VVLKYIKADMNMNYIANDGYEIFKKHHKEKEKRRMKKRDIQRGTGNFLIHEGVTDESITWFEHHKYVDGYK
jgi:hypothetical protein